MVEITVDVRAASALALLRNADKRMSYAISNALNSTAKLAQKAVHERVASKFIVRKSQFFFGSPGRPGGAAGKLSFATPASLSARLYTGEGSKGGPVLLPEFETGGIRKPFTPGAKHVAVPILGRPARPSIRQGVPPAFTFAGLKFRAYQGGKKVRRRRRGRTVDVTAFGEFGRVRLPEGGGAAGGGKIQWKGQQRTFIVPGVGVLQRFGPARGDVRIIYAFKTPFALDRRLEFVNTARAAINRHFQRELHEQVEQTLAFKR